MSSARGMAAAGAPPGPVVFMVDDQPPLVDAIRHLLAGERDIAFHALHDPRGALAAAVRIAPTVILLDLVMPEMDGLTLVRLLKAYAGTRDIPVVVLSSLEEADRKAEAFAAGADDYLVKVPERVELIARVRYHSRAYATLMQRNAAYEALADSQRQVERDIARASAYVHSLLPPPVTEGPVRSEWCLYPCTSLGGDSLGHHWIDGERFAVYLLDASGHGVGPALLSVSALNMIRSQTLPDTDFASPASVLAALNRIFQMARHDNLYFTIWYGVFDVARRHLTYAGAGHPPALLFHRAGEDDVLPTQNFFIGARRAVIFEESRVPVPGGAVLYVFSDGVFQVTRPDGSCWTYDLFREELRRQERAGGDLEGCHRAALALHGGSSLEDDYAILRVTIRH